MKKTIIAALLIFVITICSGSALLNANLSNIPKLYITNDFSKMKDKSDIRKVEIKYKDKQNSFSCYATIKLQGASTLYLPKRNYTIKFYQDADCTNKTNMDIGFGLQNEYCLKANWCDSTHSRNIVTARLAAQANKKYGVLESAPNNGVIDGFPIEVYDNNKFLGIYTFNIPKDAWLLSMDKDNVNHILVSGEAWNDATMFKAMPDFESWELETGEENKETLNKLNRVFDFVINSTDQEFTQNFNNYIDLDSVLNYYIFVDIACLRDNQAKNMLLSTYDGNKWYTTLYDLEGSWGVHYSGDKLFNYTEVLPHVVTKNNLFARIETCFAKELKERYFELRKEILTKENILSEFNAFQSTIPNSSFKKERAKWGELPGYDINQIEEYLDYIIPVLDEKYANF